MHWKKLKKLIQSMVELYFSCHIPRAAAGLSYFLTLSFFPMLICLYHMLGTMFPAAEQLRGFLTGLLPAGATEVILDFLRYVSDNTSNSMLVMALSVMVTSSSAAFRCVDNVSAEMRGEARFSGFFEVLFSILFSLVFMVALYLSVILIVTGKWFLQWADRHIMFMNISDSWSWWRFVLLFLLLFVILWMLYTITSPRRSRSQTFRLPGAFGAALALVAVSMVFSAMISVNVTYPVVYGSLASLIIMMFWLYICGIIIFLGNVLNVSLERLYGLRR